MTFSIANELRQTFDLATARKETETITAPHQWRSVRQLRERCDRARARETQAFEAHYQTRVEIVRRRLIDEAGSKARSLDHPWFPRDRFSVSDTLRQAQRIVRARHEERLSRIDRFELGQLKAISRDALRETSLRGTTRYAFAKTANRRSGQDRRHGIGPDRCG